ncbi:hypothetical protein HK102_004492, partial [Quaeritorhiza haematococci]
MYIHIANGTPYWNAILVIAIAGFLGITVENIQSTIIANVTGNVYWVWSLSILAEPCWIVSEFGIIFLNMIKFQALLRWRTFLYFAGVEGLLFLAFIAVRLRIGFLRFQEQQKDSLGIWHAHTPAFAIVSVGSLICS